MVKLVSFDVCPYVQRSVITLEEKGAPYEIETIDLNNKPEWFIKLSPLEKVPILMVEDTVIFESAAISEYLDETAPGRKLQPLEPLQRAHNRAWIEFTSNILVTRNHMQHAKTEQETRRLAAVVNGQLARLEEQLDNGPFFNGDGFSLVDAAVAPLFQRLTWLLELAPDLGVFDGLPKVTAWSKALLQRKSVKRSTVPDLRERYLAYLQGNGRAGDDKGPSWLGRIGVAPHPAKVQYG
ncbi:MAG: glutathione S-transferase family protein [Gammaproteobacteria bacterium]|nr:MAG: glutathione S-transferase family protein [Gammaproteobacteria bacterium]